MISLREIIDAAGEKNDSEKILAGFICHVDDKPLFLFSILDLTGIVYPVDDMTDRDVVNLKRIMVWPQDIHWIPRMIQDSSMRKSIRRSTKKRRTQEVA